MSEYFEERETLDVNFRKPGQQTKDLVNDRSLLLHCSPTTLNIHEFDREEGDNDVQIDDANTETLELAVAKSKLYTNSIP